MLIVRPNNKSIHIWPSGYLDIWLFWTSCHLEIWPSGHLDIQTFGLLAIQTFLAYLVAQATPISISYRPPCVSKTIFIFRLWTPTTQIRHGSNYSKQQRLRIWPGKSTEQFAMENFWDAKKLLNRYIPHSLPVVFFHISITIDIEICIGHYIKFLLIAIFCLLKYIAYLPIVHVLLLFFSRVVLLGSIEVDQKLLFWTCLDSYHLLLAPFSSSML